MNDAGQSDWRRLLTAIERAQMLDDIARVSLAVGTWLFPGQPWSDLDVSAGSLASRKSPVERLGFIERVLPLLTQAAVKIERDPLTAVMTQSRPVNPPHRARRVTTLALLQAARRGADLRSLEETIAALSHDTPENRAVKSFLRRLERDSAAIARIAAAEDESEAAERAERCGKRLHGLLLSPWWGEVGTDAMAWTQPPTRRAVLRPEYARVSREAARYRAGFRFDWDNSWLTLPQRETWRLYEAWCLFTVLDALRALAYLPAATGGGEGAEMFTVREGRLAFSLAPGRAGRITLGSPGGGQLALVYSQTFAEGRHSLSHTMQPDITLAADDRLWILDAKFKPYALAGEEGGDINQMHAYRDGITDETGRRVVSRAWCLYAGQAGSANRSQLTYGRSDEAAVGALCLRPGDAATFTRLCALLSDWLPAGPPRSARPAFPET